MKTRGLIFLIAFVFFGSCTHDIATAKYTHVLPSDSEVAAIVKVVLETENLPMMKYFNQGRWKYDSSCSKVIFDPDAAIVTNLYNIKAVNTPLKTNSVPIQIEGEINLSDLLALEYRGQTLFNSTDSVFILFQSDTLIERSISSAPFNQYRFVLKDEQHKDWEKGNRYPYFEISIPLFSDDLSIAYIEVDYHCYELCGSGMFLFLEKKNGKWQVVARQQRWIS